MCSSPCNEFISERIPRGLPRGKRANGNDTDLKNRRFSAACCGELQEGNDRGISLVEVVLAMFLLTVGILATLSLQPSAWRTAGRSDLMGRAAEILHKELESNESYIMNPCNPVAAGTTTNTVYPSGLNAAATGDVPYTVTTTVTNTGTNVWTLAVAVSWTGHAPITAKLTVTRQESFRYPAGCV